MSDDKPMSPAAQRIADGSGIIIIRGGASMSREERDKAEEEQLARRRGEACGSGGEACTCGGAAALTPDRTPTGDEAADDN